MEENEKLVSKDCHLFILAGIVFIEISFPHGSMNPPAPTASEYFSKKKNLCSALEWGKGYYNGDIKTRKTVQCKDLDAHRLGLQRSEQLRRLYQSLLDGESELGAKRPSGALSPEDLSNLEWYYLVCMSFTFKLGQSLPGKALAIGKHIWLFDAQYADSKVFSRSLLAKSASVQTVICFPHNGGVIELGTTDLVPEDLNLIQHVKTTLMEVVKPICSEKHYYSSYDGDYDDYYSDRDVTEYGHEIMDTVPFSTLYPSEEDMISDKDKQNDRRHNRLEDITVSASDDSSNDYGNHAEESVLLDSTASPFQNWHLIDEDTSQALRDSTTSHGGLSQNFDSQEESDKPPNVPIDTHYRRVLSVLESTNRFIIHQSKPVGSCRSSFRNWRNGFIVHGSTTQASQRTLKSILFKVPLMHAYSISKSEGSSAYPLKPRACHSQMSSSASKRDSEQYLVLKSMLPTVTKVLTHPMYFPIAISLTKIRTKQKEEEGEGGILYFRFSDVQLTSALMAFQTDETSILTDTIHYLKELEGRVDELESCIDFEGSNAVTDNWDLSEHTSDNYERVEDAKQPFIKKRKTCEINETDTDLHTLEVKVDMAADEVLIRMNCPWREHLLLDIMEAANNLNLDAHTVQSSTLDGILSLFFKSKIQRTESASEGTIKQALTRIISICGEVN